MKVTMIGTGYVGLVTGSCLAEFGAEVTCFDIDLEKIEKIQNGIMPIFEPGLEELVEKNVNEGKLAFSANLEDAVAGCDLIFIAVGTPSRSSDGSADMNYVYQAAKDFALHLDGYTVIVNKSTVPVGTARNLKRIISEINPQADFDVASNPEFLREGAAIADFMIPDRVVIGVENDRSARLLRELYRPLNLIDVTIVETSLESAELIKYAANAFLATKVSFINEISMICETVGADVHDIARGMGLDGRIGRKFLHPGPGYGGSCFPKDTKGLVRLFQEHGIPNRIVESVIEVNEAQKARMITKIRNAMGGSVAGKNIAVLGLTFKPMTDDMRDAPSLSILPRLVEDGARIKAHDPKGIENARSLLPKDIIYCDEIFDTVDNADAVILMTEWREYRGLPMEKILGRMRGNIFIDLRNAYEPSKMRELGFDYFSVGR